MTVTQKKSEHTKGYFLRQLGHLIVKIRHFLSPSHEGFGFVGRITIFTTLLHQNETDVYLKISGKCILAILYINLYITNASPLVVNDSSNDLNAVVRGEVAGISA
jgi:hypothetical protein